MQIAVGWTTWRARFAIRLHRLRQQGSQGHLVIAEIFGRHRLHLRSGNGTQLGDQSCAGVQRQTLNPVGAEFTRLAEHRVELVGFAGDPLGFDAIEFGLADALTRNQRDLLAQRFCDLLRGLGGDIDAALMRQRFEGEAGGAAEHFVGGRRIVAIGTGDAVSPAEAAEKLGGAAVARLLISGETAAVIDLTGLTYDADAAARVALAAALRAWRFDIYRTKLKDKQKPTLAAVTIVGAGAGAADRYASRYAALVEGVSLTRELVTEPANIIYPESFVARVKASVAGLGLEIEVLDEAAMTALGMGSLLGVSQGSVREAQILVMRWNGGTAGEAPVALLGKGVTFDTGGISIKPAAGMEAMKWDMGGAGAVAGAMKAIAGRKAKANVVGLVGIVENMPDGNAVRPGDIIRAMSGTTIEIVNTDAEGRLVLADALGTVEKERDELKGTLARAALGWQPTVSLDAGLERTIAHFEQRLGTPSRTRAAAEDHRKLPQLSQLSFG